MPLIAVMLFASSCKEQQTREQLSPMVKCVTVESLERAATITTLPGKVSPRADVNLSFRVAGIVEKVNVKEGDFIKEGQVVATMDSRDYRLQLDATEAEYDAIKAEAERVIAMYKDASVTQNDYDKAVSGLKRITSKLESHRNAYKDTNLKAPFDGYIQKINFDKGEALSAGMPMMSFISSSAPEVTINIPAIDYIRRSELISATATCDLYPNKIFHLKRVGTTHKANLNQLYETKFIIEPQDGLLPSAGMSVMVALSYENHQSSETIIPFNAVVEQDGSSYVWLLKDGKGVRQSIVLGDITSDGMVVVEQGLKAGDQLITAGLSSLKEGAQLRVMPQPTKSNVGNIL